MAPTPARWDTERVDKVVGGLLQAGVIVAASVSLIGGVLALLHRAGDLTRFTTFTGESEPLRTLGAVVQAALAGQPRAITQLGILLLIATPIARVVLSLGVFLHQRDRTYIMVTLIVLSLLMWGLLAFPA